MKSTFYKSSLLQFRIRVFFNVNVPKRSSKKTKIEQKACGFLLLYLVGKITVGFRTVGCEAQSEYQNVRQGGDGTQHHSVPQLERQHGVNCEDDEEEERHLRK